MAKTGPKPKPLAERFWNKVQKGPGCWEWTGSVNNHGYGKIGRPGGNPRLAHRVSWELAYGPIPPGLWVMHRCDNSRCVRPSHFRLGTQSDNMKDCYAKGRGGCQKDPSIIARGSAHYKATITEADVLAIRVAMKEGGCARELAAKHNLSTSSIYAICSGRIWRSVPMP